jgi:hypothetical protein
MTKTSFENLLDMLEYNEDQKKATLKSYHESTKAEQIEMYERFQKAVNL